MQIVERLILTTLINDMAAKGFRAAAVYIDDGEYVIADTSEELVTRGSDDLEDLDVIARPLTAAEVLEAVNSVDISTVHFTQQNSGDWGNRGVMIVLGNGADCISDSHVAESEPDFDKVITGIYKKIEDKTLTADYENLITLRKALTDIVYLLDNPGVSGEGLEALEIAQEALKKA